MDDFSFPVVVKPAQQGVPVTMILGYYDPQNTLSRYIYPALHCAYGKAFSSDRDIEIRGCRCYAEIRNDAGQKVRLRLRTI
ncbi:TagA domain-containing protein [Sodalis praecaptivus]|uniref:TagA domain-containing protein n=1 Tax=Sodalis TaxID=84565 RepID=UPI002FFBA0E7